MALKGRAGHRFSHAPHPMHFSVLTAGILQPLSDSTMVMAPVGQCLAQLPHSTPSATGTQLAFTHTAWPICMDDLSTVSIGLIAPVGQTSEHRVHSGRQYPSSYDDSGCMKFSMSVCGRSTPLGHADTHSWQAVQCWCRFRRLNAPGGTILVFLFGAFLSSMVARPPSTTLSAADTAAYAPIRAVAVRN